MFLPHLDYGIIVWSYCGHSIFKNKLLKLQKSAMQIILEAPFRTHIKDKLKPLVLWMFVTVFHM